MPATLGSLASGFSLISTGFRSFSPNVLKLREAEERGVNPDTATADIEQVKPGTGMTPSERNMNTKDTGSSVASSAGVVAPTPVKSTGLFGSGKRKEQFAAALKSGSKGRFVENMDT